MIKNERKSDFKLSDLFGVVKNLNLKLSDFFDESDCCLCNRVDGFFNCVDCNFKKGQTIQQYINDRISIWIDSYELDKGVSCIIKDYDDIPSECSGSNIKAHSISKSSNFKNDEKWLTFEKGVFSESSTLTTKNLGIKTSSTFRGLCLNHDGLFKIADGVWDFKETHDFNFVYQYVYRQLLNDLYINRRDLYTQKCQLETVESIVGRIYNKTGRFLNTNYYGFQKSFDNLNRNVEHLYLYSILVGESFTKKSWGDKNNGLRVLDDSDLMYIKTVPLNKDFKVNISAAYYTTLRFDGSSYKNIDPSFNGFVYIFVLYNKGNPLLIMACIRSNNRLVDFINDFTAVDNVEGYILRYSTMFDNCYYSESTLKRINVEYLKSLYLKYESLLDYSRYYKCEKINNRIIEIIQSRKITMSKYYKLKRAESIKIDKKIYRDLSLGSPIVFKDIE